MSEHLIVMGVSGCGKSTVGRALAVRLGRPFADGDDFHSTGNLAKMASGLPFTNQDRQTWLGDVRDRMSLMGSSVVACSALRREYRDVYGAPQARCDSFISQRIELWQARGCAVARATSCLRL